MLISLIEEGTKVLWYILVLHFNDRSLFPEGIVCCNCLSVDDVDRALFSLPASEFLFLTVVFHGMMM